MHAPFFQPISLENGIFLKTASGYYCFIVVSKDDYETNFYFDMWKNQKGTVGFDYCLSQNGGIVGDSNSAVREVLSYTCTTFCI